MDRVWLDVDIMRKPILYIFIIIKYLIFRLSTMTLQFLAKSLNCNIKFVSHRKINLLVLLKQCFFLVYRFVITDSWLLTPHSSFLMLLFFNSNSRHLIFKTLILKNQISKHSTIRLQRYKASEKKGAVNRGK